MSELRSISDADTSEEVIDLDAPAPPGSPTELVALNGRDGRLLRLDIPPVLVIGCAGGGGTTTTALGLAAAITTADTDETVSPIVVDATPTGGDLASRGCDRVEAAGTVQSWLTMTNRSLADVVLASCGETSATTGVLPRGPEALPRRESYLSVHRDLCEAGCLPVYDGGSPVTNRAVAPLLCDPRIALVITLASRADAVNRLKPALIWLDDHYSEYHIADAVLVVTRQSATATAEVAEHARTYLGTWVRAVVEIPYDQHLATGGEISWSRLASDTRRAYRHVVGLLR
ncbi:Uncharacterised protein [Nocardia otitidiscaviarum]|uniref:Flp pilus assembly protein, ATPase CpaE n=1 Tax=Nocardia otitidiscaviarum TaxID=1823 RepID=A0A379JLP7_9NOCA|nr:hypothetical protein [Nocardia otitidiscaviarum]SUD49589.1 Uncharacterised protein [Nocardia otitidiscaviarum]